MDTIMQFFDFAKPCPPEIPDCQAVRHQYGVDLETVRRQGGCGTCAERNLRQQYIIKLQNLINQ